MTLEEAKEAFRYDDWANALLLEAVSELSPEEMLRSLGTSHEGVLGTFVHLVAAEAVWLSRWKGAPLAKLAGVDEIPSLDALNTWWEEVREARNAFISGLDDASLAEETEIGTTTGAVYRHRMDDMIRHLVNHSTYHRGQVAALMRQLGRRPPSTDWIRFYRERQ